jgi:hypothetical protein
MIGQTTPSAAPEVAPEVPESKPVADDTKAKEFGGREGPEPTRYGDWEKNGRCIDF